MNKDVPGGPLVKNLPAMAEDMDSIPSLGTSHMPPRSWATCNNYEPACPRARAPQQEEPPQWEVWAPQPESGPTCRN